MVAKIVSALAQVAILLLAIILMFVISKKQVFDSSMEDFQRRIDNRLEDDRRYYEGKINRLQEQLDSFITSREVRIRLINDRFELLEKQIREQKSQQNFMLYNNSNSGNQVKAHKELEQQ